MQNVAMQINIAHIIAPMNLNQAGIERAGTPRPETPEPGSRQGRRNAEPGIQLLDDDGAISDEVRPSGLFFSLSWTLAYSSG